MYFWICSKVLGGNVGCFFSWTNFMVCLLVDCCWKILQVIWWSNLDIDPKGSRSWSPGGSLRCPTWFITCRLTSPLGEAVALSYDFFSFILLYLDLSVKIPFPSPCWCWVGSPPLLCSPTYGISKIYSDWYTGPQYIFCSYRSTESHIWLILFLWVSTYP